MIVLFGGGYGGREFFFKTCHANQVHVMARRRDTAGNFLANIHMYM